MLRLSIASSFKAILLRFQSHLFLHPTFQCVNLPQASTETLFSANDSNADNLTGISHPALIAHFCDSLFPLIGRLFASPYVCITVMELYSLNERTVATINNLLTSRHKELFFLTFLIPKFNIWHSKMAFHYCLDYRSLPFAFRHVCLL